MPKKYRGYCKNCGEYYIGFGAQYCNQQCYLSSKENKRKGKNKRDLADKFWEKVKIGERMNVGNGKDIDSLYRLWTIKKYGLEI